MGKILLWVLVIIGGLFLSRMLTHYAARKRQEKEQPNKCPKAHKVQLKKWCVVNAVTFICLALKRCTIKSKRGAVKNTPNWVLRFNALLKMQFS